MSGWYKYGTIIKQFHNHTVIFKAEIGERFGECLGECFEECLRERLWECLEECIKGRLEDRSGLPRGDSFKCFSYEASALYDTFIALFVNNSS